MLLNGRCSWSYKSLKDDGTKKKDTNLLLRTKSSDTTAAYKNTEVYNFEVPQNKKKKFNKKKGFKSSGSEKDDPCYDCDEFIMNKKTKSKKKIIKNNKNVNDLCESPSITSKALRHKKRINYADSEEFDLILDKSEDSTVQTGKKSTRNHQDNISGYADSDEFDLNLDNNEGSTEQMRKKSNRTHQDNISGYADSDEFDLISDNNEGSTKPSGRKSTLPRQDNISRDSEYSDDEGLVFQTRYSDKNACLAEITSSIESNSNDLFKSFEETDKTTTTPMILKFHKNLEGKPNEKTSSDNRVIHFEDSLQKNEVQVHEKSESPIRNASESENSFNYSPEVGYKKTNRKSPIPREFSIDIKADLIEKCEKIYSDIQGLHNDYKLSEEISVGDINRNLMNGMNESHHQLEKFKSADKETCEKKNSKRDFDLEDNKNVKILSKNKRTLSSNNSFTEKKSDYQILDTSSSISDFIEEIVDINIIEESMLPEYGSENTADMIKGQIVEKNSGSKQNNETKGHSSVKNFDEWQSSCEEENAENQSTVKKEIFFKKMESSLNWDKNLDTEIECIPSSSFIKKGSKLRSSEKTLSVNNNGILKTNSETLTYYFDNSMSHNSAESDNISEKDGGKYSLEAQRFEKTKDIRLHKDSFNMNESKTSNFRNKGGDSTSTNQQGIFLKNDGFNIQLSSKQINKRNVRKRKKVEGTQENNQETSSFDIHKDTDLMKQNFKNKVSKEKTTNGNPKTWEDLEAKLLSETDEDFCKISSNSYQEIRGRDNLWIEKKEFEARKITKGFYQTTSKETKKNLSLKDYINKSINSDCKEVLPITNSPNLNIINKAIQAMEKCTARYVSPFENDVTDDFQIYEENALDEYSISVHSTVIQSSKNKLSATNTFFQKTSKINKNVKKGKKILNVKENSIDKNSLIPTAKINVLKEKKVANHPKPTKNSTKQIMKNLKKITDQDSSDNFTNCNFDMDKNSDSSTEDISALYNYTVLPHKNNSDTNRQNFFPIETNAENRYSFRKRKNKPTTENISKKFKTELISSEMNSKKFSNQNAADDLNSLTRTPCANTIISKNKLNSPTINLSEKSKDKDDFDSGADSKISFNYSDEIVSQLDLLNIETNTVKERSNKLKSFKNKQNNNSNIQSLNNSEAKVNFDKEKHMNVSNLENMEENIQTAKNKCENKSDFDLVSKNSKGKIKQIKKRNTRKKYKEYLKKLFQSENTSLEEKIQKNEDKSSKNTQKEGNYDRKESKLIMKDDELFSLSSDDSEMDESGVFSEVNLTQYSGLFFDVLDEKDN